jgi:hypothetical protein
MIGTLAWKEYREHRTVWVALAGLTVGVMGSLLELLEPLGNVPAGSNKEAMLAGTAFLLAACYGLVCGAMMLAGEREAGTQDFLDAWTGRRGPIWRSKVVTGLALTLGHSLLGAVLLGWLELKPAGAMPPFPYSILAWIVPLAAMEFAALCWGLLASAMCRDVLAAVVVGLLGFVLIALTVAVVVIGMRAEAANMGMVPILALAALEGSRRIYCHSDRTRVFGRNRQQLIRLVVSPRRGRERDGGSWLQLWWLCWRQGWMVILLLALAAPTLALLLASSNPVVWPVVSGLVGVVCGLGVFIGEQASGSWRFLGDQRLPAGRIWAIKTGFWLMIAVGLAALALVVLESWLPNSSDWTRPTQGAIPSPRFSIDRVLANGAGAPSFMFVWLLYGFSMAQAFALVARKAIVAAVLALPVTALVLALWMPSMVVGGLRIWQPWGIPVLLLIGSRLAMRPWLSGRLRTRKPALGLVAWGVLLIGWLGGALAYRVVEVPAPREPFSVHDFVKGFPTLEANGAGRLIRQAADDLQKEKDIPQRLNALPLLLGGMSAEAGGAAAPAAVPPFQTRPLPNDQAALDQQLDQLFTHAWAKNVRQGAELPLGVILDPRDWQLNSPAPVLPSVQNAGRLFNARALLLIRRGNLADALEHLHVVLALSRQLRHLAPSESAAMGQALEWAALDSFEKWRQSARVKPDLLRRALDELAAHEQQLPPPSDQVKADYLVFRNSTGKPLPQAGSPSAWVVELVGAAQQVPWEQRRLKRIADSLFSGLVRAAEADYWRIASRATDALGDWVAAPQDDEQSRYRMHRLLSETMSTWAFTSYRSLAQFRRAQAEALNRVRAARLELAVALFQAEEGRPPKEENDLVPHYLPSVPTNPLTGLALALPSVAAEIMPQAAP